MRLTAGFKHYYVKDDSKVPRPTNFKVSNAHPKVLAIWRYDAWRDFDVGFNAIKEDSHLTAPYIPTEVYERLLPAISLASSILERTRGFLERILFADIVDTSTREQGDSTALYHGWEPNSRDRKRFEQMMDEFTQTYRIYRTGGDSHEGGFLYGETHSTKTRRGEPRRICSSLNAEIMKVIGRHDFDSRPLEHKQALWLVIATTLVHEFAHAVNYLRHSDCKSTADRRQAQCCYTEEPTFYPHENLQELGFRLEFELFGGEITFGKRCNSKGHERILIDGSAGLEIEVVNSNAGTKAGHYRLSTSSIAEMFSIDNFVTSDAREQKPVKIYLLPLVSEAEQYWKKRPKDKRAIRRHGNPLSSRLADLMQLSFI